MDLQVERRPNTREQALELAREHYVYCNDIVDQSETGTLSSLAACLFVDNWWNFWWD